MNKKILLITLTAINAGAIVAHNGGGGFGGGFATGALTGALITSAATSNRDRGPEYYDYKRDRDEANRIRSRKRELERDLKTMQQKKRKIERNLERTTDSEKKTDLKAEKEEVIKNIQRIEDRIDDLG